MDKQPAKSHGRGQRENIKLHQNIIDNTYQKTAAHLNQPETISMQVE